MKKRIATIALSLACATCVLANNNGEARNNFDARVGWSLGGTMPLDMPASIRALNKYDVDFNLQLGVDYERQFNNVLGLEVGIKLERKSMSIDASVKNYEMSIAQGEEVVSGNFTGKVVTQNWFYQTAIPVQIAVHPSEKVKIKAGPYVALALDKGFSGYAYDGYLREGNPTGPRTELGCSEDERGNYDFSSDVHAVNWGIDLGVDWYLTEKFGLYADVTWGLNSIFPDGFKTISQKMYPIYGTLGCVFKISK